MRLEASSLQKVAVFRALNLGDMMCAVPALRALRLALPEAEIVLIGLPWASAFARRFRRYVDRFLQFPGYPGILESLWEPARTAAFLQEAQREHFDLAVQMHGSGVISNPFAVLLGAAHTAGFCVPGQWRPDAGRFISYPIHEPEIRRLLGLVEYLGFPPKGEHVEFPLCEDDRAEVRQLEADGFLPPGGYVCMHAGCRALARRWPVDQFAAVGDALAERGLPMVLTGSTEEAGITGALAEMMRRRPIDLAGRLSLGGLAALLERASLLICNDTGVSHVADALRVPSVVAFVGSDPAVWAPFDRRRHRPLRLGEGLSPEAVIAEALDLLEEYSERRESRAPAVDERAGEAAAGR